MQKKFRIVDNITGWVIFLIAAVTYCLTIEPTASFWDCPEFITTGYKLEIGHPPGAPFFMLTANLFSQFASDASQVARMVNTMSALLSATCILFLFWTISNLTRKLICEDGVVTSLSKLIAIEGSGIVGALIYTWSDTFWFSAVEGEVYAYSSAFTAVVFWLILKWEDNADQPHSDRWLVLITYMTGLSIGVHLLNLLCIPAICLVYYYKKVPNANLKGSLIALALSFVLVAVVLYGVVPGIITVGGWFELLFVNVLGCPFNTGMYIYMVLLAAVVGTAIWATFMNKAVKMQNALFVASVAMLGIPFINCMWSGAITGIVILVILWFVLKMKRKKGKAVGDYYVTPRLRNTALLCMLMLIIGYSSYAVIVIRSAANPPMDQNSPEDIFTLGSYLSRDQYGDSPLIYGNAFSSEIQVEGDRYKTTKKAPIYQQVAKHNPSDPDRYFINGYKEKLVYRNNMLFPRMHDRAHADDYFLWMGGTISGVSRSYDDNGSVSYSGLPSFIDNLKFFVTYQCNYMYWRYFLWNFSGRQNDIQGTGFGDLEHGNWLTGISFIDTPIFGDQSKLPDDLKANKGHNVFYMLPLLLGLIGLFWQAFRGNKGIQQFWVVFFLFFMTGLAIVLYLNQTPSQPRERDYAYAGSFYAFAIWCGMGVAAIIDLIERKLKKSNVIISAIVSVLALLVPIQMVSQTWDDHDRSGRYTCRDFGHNYLMSLDPGTNPIIFTNGDNDTFPLWYNQDVEGVGTDVRVCNLSYLQTDWYIDQMVRPAYNSPALPITWPRYCYSGQNDYVYVVPDQKQQILAEFQSDPKAAAARYGADPFEITNIMKHWVCGAMNAYQDEDGKPICIIPTDTIFVNIDPARVSKAHMMKAGDVVPTRMAIPINSSSLNKSQLMMLEIIAHSGWTRPVYVATTVGSENFFSLGNNFVQEGLAYRITPWNTRESGKSFDTERVYRNVMTRFKFGNLKQRGLYLDETTMRMCMTHKRLFAQLANTLIDEGKLAKAKKVLAYMEKEIPEYNVPNTPMAGGIDIAYAYSRLGMKKQAYRIADFITKQSEQYINWYFYAYADRFDQATSGCLDQIQNIATLFYYFQESDPQKAKQLFSVLLKNWNSYCQRGGYVPEVDSPRYGNLVRIIQYYSQGGDSISQQ